MSKVTITIIRNDTIQSKQIRFIQTSIYNEICKHIFTESDKDFKNWTKEELADPHKVLEIENTYEECKGIYDTWVQMKPKTWTTIKNTIKESKLFRRLPIKLRNIESINYESDYYIRFRDYLQHLGIYFDIELEK